MLPILRIVGEDVLFTHWRVKPERLKSTLPAPLTVDTYDGSGWVTVLAHEVTEAGLDAIPVSPFSGFGEVNLRTYVTFNEDQGVFFFSCNTGQELNALLGEQVFGLPHRRASVSFNRRGEEIVVRCRQTGSGSAGRFDVKYQPTGTPSPAEPGSLIKFLAERHTYFSPTDPEKERPGSFIVGSIERDPWQLSDVNTDIRTNTMFDRLPTELPSKPSEAHYSPRFESRFVGRETVKI